MSCGSTHQERNLLAVRPVRHSGVTWLDAPVILPFRGSPAFPLYLLVWAARLVWVALLVWVARHVWVALLVWTALSVWAVVKGLVAGSLS